MPQVQVTLRLKSGQLSASLKMAQANSKRLPSYLANKACQYISLRAYQDMPRVQPAVIDQELEVSAHGITAKGRLSRAKRPRRIQIGSHESSLASRIILARFYPQSPFNITTGQVRALNKPPTRGSAEFWQWISQKAAQMTKSRHSASGFFAACAKAVNMGFFRVTRATNVPGRNAAEVAVGVNQTTHLLAAGLAQVWPATGDSGHARFAVSTTEADTKGTPGGALNRRILPVWQRAVDAETRSILEHARQTYAATLRRAGFKVTT